MKLGDNMTMEACNMWGDVCPRKCRPPRIGDIPKHCAVDEESPGSSANKLTISPTDPSATVLEIPVEPNRDPYSLGTPNSPGVFHAVPKYEARNDLTAIDGDRYASGKQFHKVHGSFQQECHSVSQPAKDALSKSFYVTSDALRKSPSPPRHFGESKLSADVHQKSIDPCNRITIKLPATSTEDLVGKLDPHSSPAEQQESTRIPSSPDEALDSEILQVRKDSALFLEEAEGLPTLREILKTRAPRYTRPRRESSGYASNLGTFDEDRRNSSTADVLQDFSTCLKERRRSSTKRLNSRIALGRAEDSLGEETSIGQTSVSERMPTTEINRKISSAGLEMPNIEEVKELQRDELSSGQESIDDLCTLVGNSNVDELPARCHLLGQPSNHKPTSDNDIRPSPKDLTKPTIPATAEFLVSKDAFSVTSLQETVVHRASTQTTPGSTTSSGQTHQQQSTADVKSTVEERKSTRTPEGQHRCQKTKDEVDRSAISRQIYATKVRQEDPTLNYKDIREREDGRCAAIPQQSSSSSAASNADAEKAKRVSQDSSHASGNTQQRTNRPSKCNAQRLNVSEALSSRGTENGSRALQESAPDRGEKLEQPDERVKLSDADRSSISSQHVCHQNTVLSNVSSSPENVRQDRLSPYYAADKHQRANEHAKADHKTDDQRSARVLDEGSRLAERQSLKQSPRRDAGATTLGTHDEAIKVCSRSVKMYQLLSTQSEDRGDGTPYLADRRISLQIPRQDDDSAPIVLSSGKSILGVTSPQSGQLEGDVCRGRSRESMTTETTSDTPARKLSSPGEVGVGKRHLGDGSNVSVRPIYPDYPYSPYGSPQGSPRNHRRPLRESRRVSIDNKQGELQLNQYKLLDNIGQGSYGIVKLAYNEEDETHYAMKILSKKKLMKKAGIFGRMAPGRKGAANPLAKVYREIALLKKLDHPNVVKLVEVLDDPDEDNLYLVFELVQKGEVLQIPTDKPLDEETARKNFRDVVMGVEYLHYQRIVHRDIKPSNLLVDSEGRIKIADLGVSAELRASGELLSGPAGTPAFAAPETTTPGAHYSGTLCDVWSMGVTLYSLVTGRVPWDGAGSIIGVQAAVRSEPLKFPEKPALSDDLRDIISGMLAKEPSARIALRDLKEHSWLTNGGKEPLPSEADNCRLPVTVTDEEVERVVTRVPKLDTLILIKTMLKQHSFQNPFLPKRVGRTNCNDSDGNALELSSSERTAEASVRRDTIRNVKTDRFHRAGRSNSAPDSYNWQTNGRQISVESPLPPVTEASSQESEVERR